MGKGGIAGGVVFGALHFGSPLLVAFATWICGPWHPRFLATERGHALCASSESRKSFRIPLNAAMVMSAEAFQ